MSPEERIVFLGMFFLPFAWGLWTRRIREGIGFGAFLATVFRFTCH